MITLKQGDTGIGIKATLTSSFGRVDLAGANVLFLFGDQQIQCNVVNKFQRDVTVTFLSSHTAKIGDYKAEFEVSYPNGRVETFPNDGYIKVRILKDLGGVNG